MLGPEKAEFLATLVENPYPPLIVECGTAIGYSGLCLLQVLSVTGNGWSITIEMEVDHAHEAQEQFVDAGLSKFGPVTKWECCGSTHKPLMSPLVFFCQTIISATIFLAFKQMSLASSMGQLS